jgi:hypothetical protein
MTIIKKSGIHDDFENFVGNRSELFYLHLWLQEKPQLQPMLVINLLKELFFDSAQPEQTGCVAGSIHSPTNSDYSSKSGGKSTLAASVNALIEERRKSRELSQQRIDPYVAQLTKKKLEMQTSKNLEDNINCLIEIKQKLQVESDPGIVKLPKKV